MTGYLLSYILFLPLVAGVPILFVRDAQKVRWIALMATGGVFLLILTTYVKLSYMQVEPGTWLLLEDREWIEAFGIRYTLALDGLSLVMAVLSALLFVLGVGVSWKAVTRRVGLYYFMLLLLETGVLGVFFATDLFLFYLFWEIMLIPMFFLIGVWGHGRRIYSALKFFIYTVSGSLLMLAAIIGLYLLHGEQTYNYTFTLDSLMGTAVPGTLGLLMFGAFLLAFAVKVPVFPLHTWLPDAHTDAPTAGSVILAGLLLKTGTYGLIRFGFPLFPQAASQLAPLLFGLGLVGLYYASWIAFAQTDMKRLVAYSSIAHLGIVVLGIAAWNSLSLAGAVLQMVNHGISTGALFIMVGMLDERMHTRDISAFGGLWGRAPVLSSFMLLFILSSAGLPGLNNFPGEFMVFLGLFERNPVLAGAAFFGIVGTLIYLLALAQKLLFGRPAGDEPLSDLEPRELAIVVPLALLVVVLGLYPSLVTVPIEAPVTDLVKGYPGISEAFASVPGGLK